MWWGKGGQEASGQRPTGSGGDGLGAVAPRWRSWAHFLPVLGHRSDVGSLSRDQMDEGDLVLVSLYPEPGGPHPRKATDPKEGHEGCVSSGAGVSSGALDLSRCSSLPVGSL